MLTQILTTVIVAVVTAVMGVIGKAVNDWSKREKETAEVQKNKNTRLDVVGALQVGVHTVSKTIVDGMKAAAVDGKLSKGEIRDVQYRAIDEATKIATNPEAVEFLTTSAFETLAALVTGIVQSKKK